MKGTVVLSRDKIFSIVEVIEAMEKHVGTIEEVEISFGETLPDGTSANWIKPIMEDK